MYQSVPYYSRFGRFGIDLDLVTKGSFFFATNQSQTETDLSVELTLLKHCEF